MKVDRSMLKLRAMLALTVSVLGLGLAQTARADLNPNLVNLTVVDRQTGQTLQVWSHHGRMFVAGQPNTRYSLRITNRTGDRLLMVMSVDGINILTGEPAGYGQRGYVFDPYQSYDVNGWRKSDTEVAAFTFTPQSNSYAARTGRPLDIGVIGVAAFRERPSPVAPPAATSTIDGRAALSDTVIPVAPPSMLVPPAPHRAGERSAPRAFAPGSSEAAAVAPRTEKLGTAHGAREWSLVTTVPFERASNSPDLIQRIEYDSYDNLIARGVIRRPGETGRSPRAFPNSDVYVPDPPGGV